MKKNNIGPLLTLAAVAAVGGGIWVANVSQETESTAPAAVVAQSTATTTASAAAPSPSPSPPGAFPATANYVGAIPTATGVITLEVTIDGQRAIAYACDDSDIEVWLRGSAIDGVLALADTDQTSRLSGRLDGASIAGTLTIGAKSWDFTGVAT